MNRASYLAALPPCRDMPTCDLPLIYMEEDAVKEGLVGFWTCPEHGVQWTAAALLDALALPVLPR